MTIDKKNLMSLDEIKSLSFSCKCGALMTIPITTEGVKSLPQTCVHCNTDILQNHQSIEVTIRNVLSGVQSLVLWTKDSRFKLFLEVAGDNDE